MTFAEETKRAIQVAQSLARENRHELFAPAHLLLGLLHNDVGLGSWLAVQGKDVPYLRDWAEVRLESHPKSVRVPDSIHGNERIRTTMELADLIRLQLSQDTIAPLAVLAAMLKSDVAFSAEQLKSFPLTQKELLEAAAQEESVQQAVAPIKEVTPGKTGSSAGIAWQKYCTDKTALAAEGRLDPIIGRERETRMVAEILGRRTKPNVIIVGEPGVGKTALIDGFAQDIQSGKIPPHLQGATLLELDLGALVAGASYKGEVEDRIKSILKGIKQLPKAILFVDEIHVLLDAKGSLGTGVAQLLKPELARGEITMIGATTHDEYRQYIEADEAFSRRFELLRVEEPDPHVAVRMIGCLLPFYEKHHQITVAPGTVEEAVRLAKRYVKDRRLPDAAVDLLDRTMAAIRMMDANAQVELLALQANLSSLAGDLLLQEEAHAVRELTWFHTQFKNRVSHILLNQWEDDTPLENLESSEQLLTYLRTALQSLLGLASAKKDQVEKADVAAMISGKTGIPLGKIQSRERDKLLRMDEVLQKRVVGQEHAVQALCESILESRSGLTRAGQPTGSFFLLGPTGTGKTELAKALADFLFNDEAFLIRFDMSEFKEEHSAALLYGAPPGYVGYEEGGLLVNKIRQKPYSVVLFDEIEKAHPSVFDIFLQILDEGKLHDRLGKEGDFSNAVVLFTSNIGSEFVIKQFSEGRIPSQNQLMEIMAKHFRPEFLARLTEIVPFAPISESNAVKIFNIHLRSLVDACAKQGILLEVSDEAREYLALSGFNPQYGARPLKGVIRNRLRRPISRLIVGEELTKGSTLRVDTDKGGELTWVVSGPSVDAATVKEGR
jgi:ATP-dependent Clp protease ATP-binding subunit ClpB